LSRKEKNNPLLLGEPGVGKTALIHGLAKKIFNETVPDILSNKRILNLDLNGVVAGTIYRGEFESRLKQIIDETILQDDVILFIDEIHNLVGAGSASGSLDAANILKPYLARGELSCIGATTMAEYKAHFENDATLDRRFQPIIIEEPTTEETFSILSGLKPQLEEFHRITITNDAIKEAVTLSDRFLPHRFFPDKAIDLLDEAASRAKVIHSKDVYGKKIKLVKHTLKKLQEQKEKAVRNENFQKAISFKGDEERLLIKLHNLKKKQLKLQKTKVGAIDKEHIAQIVSSMLHIPFLEVNNINTEKLLNLESALGNHVFGQEKVLGEIAKTLRRSEAGLSDPKRPLASFIFLGPSGVGKTETVKAIAEELFGDRNALIRINMSEFQESFNVSKLIGAPAGYVGYKEGNQLADKVRQKPYSVVLFDEMEKAHSDVFNLLLQVLEDGYMQDAAGKHINFKNTIIIFTSNIGLERFNQVQQLGFGARKSTEREHIQAQFEIIKERILEELYSTYRVEFLNRIDKLLVFDPLQPKTVLRIVEKTVNSLNDRLTCKGITVALSPAAKKLLAKESFSPDDGARSVRRVIQEKVEELLVEKILKKEFGRGDVVTVQAKGKVISVQK
jgi:ATP-dependent Clp protease ATP-binding subunit ClpC